MGKKNCPVAGCTQKFYKGLPNHLMKSHRFQGKRLETALESASGIESAGEKFKKPRKDTPRYLKTREETAEYEVDEEATPKANNLIAGILRNPDFKKAVASNLSSSTTSIQQQERDEDTASDNETYGLSPAFLQQLDIKPPLVNRVFVTGFPGNCGVGKLFEVFSLAGKIIWFDPITDNEGKIKGMAIIQYSHPIEAVQAISMLNNQRLFDRTLSVKMDRFEKEIERQPGELPSGLCAIGMGLGTGGAPSDVASILFSLATVNNAAMAVQQEPIVQPFIQQPRNANQSFPQASFPAANPSLNGPFGNNGNDMGQIGFNSVQFQPQQMFKTKPVQQQMFKPEPVQQMYKQKPQAIFKVVPQQSQQQQPSASYGDQNNGFFHNSATQPVNNGPPPINTPGYPSSSNVYAKMGPQINNYGQPSQQQKKQRNRVILIKNLPMGYTWQKIRDLVQKFGNVENIELISHGVAKVHCVSINDAKKIRKKFSGSTVEGRIIAIEYL